MRRLVRFFLATAITTVLACYVARATNPFPTNSGASSNAITIARLLRSKAEVIKPAAMRAYTNRIPGTEASYTMVVIPGGEFMMGSPIGSRFAKKDEQPPHRVKLEPFWMGRCEVTWNEYHAFWYFEDEWKRRTNAPTADGRLVDAITRPTPPYVDVSFGMGKKGYPAIAMTPYAANLYCQWFSGKTGHFYRLPTEAEWEYAARAGTTNTWYCGEDESQLPKFAWFFDNANDKYQRVGHKLPNGWGLHDMLGNVGEWVLDQFDEGFYEVCASNGTVVMPWRPATKAHPHSVRGGSWQDDAESVRCAARGRSDASWHANDPQRPRSPFWFIDGNFVGFRIVRPLTVPTVEEMCKYWSSVRPE